ncbi:cytosolic protein [Lentibacillus saliphilus]|uniref:cytosolic protein n=1 Tax=Lentibacillus saliphilus TaxID=2737028 RepID=UPI001C2FE693|nr:cytosolic protein [Lentibacillus saliphilus]
MSFRQTIAKYFSNHAETRDKHEDPALQSHYYKATKDQALAKLEELFSNKQLYDLNAISKEHGEISVYTKKGKKVFIITTVIMVRPFQTAIDLSVTSESVLPFDFGYSNKVIKQLYDTLDQQLPKLDRN